MKAVRESHWTAQGAQGLVKKRRQGWPGQRSHTVKTCGPLSRMRSLPPQTLQVSDIGVWPSHTWH
jgi:hypothetical protein